MNTIPKQIRIRLRAHERWLKRVDAGIGHVLEAIFGWIRYNVVDYRINVQEFYVDARECRDHICQASVVSLGKVTGDCDRRIPERTHCGRLADVRYVHDQEPLRAMPIKLNNILAQASERVCNDGPRVVPGCRRDQCISYVVAAN